MCCGRATSCSPHPLSSALCCVVIHQTSLFVSSTTTPSVRSVRAHGEQPRSLPLARLFLLFRLLSCRKQTKKNAGKKVCASPTSGSLRRPGPDRAHHLVELCGDAPFDVRPLHRGDRRHAQLVHVRHDGLRVDGRRRHKRGERRKNDIDVVRPSSGGCVCLFCVAFFGDEGA